MTRTWARLLACKVGITTATGLTAGVDLSLHIVERFYGRKVAQHLADYEEWLSQGWVNA